jgi:hypothetical protein
MSQEARNMSIYSSLIGAVTLNDNLQQIQEQSMIVSYDEHGYIYIYVCMYVCIALDTHQFQLSNMDITVLLVPGCKVNNKL